MEAPPQQPSDPPPSSSSSSTPPDPQPPPSDPPSTLPSDGPPPPSSSSSSTPNPQQTQEQEPMQTPPPQPQPHQPHQQRPPSEAPRSRPPVTAPTQRGGGVGPAASNIANHQRAPPSLSSSPNPFSSLRPSHPYFTSAPSPSFPQPPIAAAAAALHRSSGGGGPDHPPSVSSTGQVRQPVPGVQTIGVIGSLSTAPASSQIRSITNQQRLGQGQPPQVRSASPSANQTKFQTHGIPRGPSTAAITSQSPAPSNLPSLQQQRMSNQGKQMSSMPSSSSRPPMKQPIMQQRPHLQQQQQQLPQNQPQASRAHVSTISKPTVQASAQTGLRTLVPGNDAAEASNEIISRKRIRQLVTQVDRSENLRPEIEDDLTEIAEDFVESIVTAACQLAKHRKSTILEAKDILLHVERHWNMTLPGFSGDEIKCYKKQSTNDVHRDRLAVVKKSMVGLNEAGSAKNFIAGGGQAAANPKAHAS